MKYEVVDVFARRPLEGNPLTVVHGQPENMQAIARETNHSETTFVLPEQDWAVPTRIFTPGAELPFAGHPTLGTAFVTGASALDLKVGRIPVAREGDLLWMMQKEATFQEHSTQNASDCLGVPVRSSYIGSTGTPVGLFEVANSGDLRTASLDAGRYNGPDIAIAYVYTTNGDHDIHARSFGAFVGVPEDPATGGAAGPLAGLLHERGELNGERIIHQGIEMQRPSYLHARFDGTPRIGGEVQRVAQGEFLNH